jgi:hypothetical protein
MYEYLDQHPAIFMSPRKEPGYLCPDLDSGSYLDSLSFMRDEERYLELFARAPEGTITGEATTWYLYSKAAATRIEQVNPDARIVIMLRDPAEMLYSLHGRRLYGGSEDLARFEDALDAEADRRQGRRIPERARNVTALFYRDVGRYHDQVRRYLEAFGSERVHIIIFEEFREDTSAAYRNALEFLEVDASFEPDFAVVNANAARRSQRLRHLMLSPAVVRGARFLIPRRLHPRVGPIIDALTTKQVSRLPLAPATREKLKGELRDDVVRLSSLIGRDLVSRWGY